MYSSSIARANDLVRLASTTFYDPNMKITPTALTVTQILSSGSEQYVIPAYQRRYSWGYNQLIALWDDIDMLDGGDTHLLGTIVCLAGHHSAGLNQLELVDGQQRLTSLCIILYCIVARLERENETDEASDLRRLLSAKALGGPPQPKLLVDSLDAEQFRDHARGREPDQVANLKLASAFEMVGEWVAEIDLTELAAFLYKLKNQDSTSQNHHPHPVQSGRRRAQGDHARRIRLPPKVFHRQTAHRRHPNRDGRRSLVGYQIGKVCTKNTENEAAAG